MMRRVKGMDFARWVAVRMLSVLLQHPRMALTGVVQQPSDCGILSRGFAVLACSECTERIVVGFSCRGLGFCALCFVPAQALEFVWNSSWLLVHASDRQISE